MFCVVCQLNSVNIHLSIFRSLVVTKVSNVFTSKETVTVPERVLELVRKKADCIPILNVSSIPVQSAVSVRGKVTHVSEHGLLFVEFTIISFVKLLKQLLFIF